MLSTSQEKDYRFFTEHLKELLADDLKVGKFAVISGERIRGLYDSFEAALKYASMNFAEGEYIIQQIISDDSVVGFLRLAVV